MQLKDFHVWNAVVEAGQPICVGNGGDWSLTIYTDNNTVSGVLLHEYDKSGRIVNVVGEGNIPAVAVAEEQNARV